MEEKKSKTDALIVSIGKEKAIVDEAVESGREDEEACAKLQVQISYSNTPKLAILQENHLLYPLAADFYAPGPHISKQIIG